jgi:hypothetical protein
LKNGFGAAGLAPPAAIMMAFAESERPAKGQ